MLKILNGFDWLEDENTKEVEECVQKGLLRYTDDESRPQFIALESNIPAIKEILKDNYLKFDEKDFIKWLKFDFGGCYQDLVIENSFSDKISVDMDDILEMVSDEDVEWISNDKKLEIYNAECPSTEVYDVLCELGKEQAKVQILDLLNSISNQTFR